MRLLLLLTLGVSLCVAIPQEGRTRLRGARRFSLATPGLQKDSQADAEANDAAAAAGEPSAAAPEETEPKTRSRGTSLLRRGRPSLRVRGRGSSSRTQETAAAEPVATKVREETPQETSGSRRGGTRLRRLRKKPVTTTTTTTTAAPEEETMMKNEEMPVEGEQKMMEEGTQAKEVTAEESPVPMAEKEPSVVKDEANTIVEETPTEPTDVKPESSPKPRLRPIPIKIGRRGQKKEAKEAPRESAVDEPTEEQAPTPARPKPTTHRFSSRPRPTRIQSRLRTSSRQQPEEHMEQDVAATEAIQEENTPKPQRPQARGRVPAFRRRGRPSEAEQKPQETPADAPAAEESPAEQESISRSDRFGQRGRRG